MRIEVHKFGGTSVLGAQRMKDVARLVESAAKNARIVVVASAMSGVTNLLVEATAAAKAGDRDKAHAAIDKIRRMHAQALDAVEGPTGPVRTQINTILDDLTNVIRGAELIGEVTPRTRDRIVATGEKLSVRIIALILRQMGHKSEALDADTFVDTDATYSDANPLPFVTDRAIAATLLPRLEKGEIPVVTGFMGRAPDGSTTTFSRGGSDFTATLLAGALDADEVTIWTDVDGVFTTDPRIVPGAKLIPQLNYREAGEMSYYGAKVLHQRTMIPVSAKRIPVWVKNTLNPGAPGSVVDGRTVGSAHPVKAVTAIKDQALISVEGKGMSGVPGVSARLFGALASRAISVTMISQSSSESSVCLAVPGTDAIVAEAALKKEFRADIARGDIEDIAVRQGVALVAAVGLGMAHTPGVAGGVFTALGAEGVNILAIAQGSSELNITLAVDQSQVNQAIAAIHSRFALDGSAATSNTNASGTTDVVLLGCGQVGRALIRLIQSRNHRSDTRDKLRITTIADRASFIHNPGGLTDAELESAISAKQAKRPLPSATPGDFSAAIEKAASNSPTGAVVADVSDSSDSPKAMLAAFARGMHIVTANKRPLADSFSDYHKLTAAAISARRELRAEATVGAGLPVIDTLRMLIETGDTVSRIEGCFSGTLGFIMTKLEAGAKFSEVVEEAIRLGYTEPDPVVDLSGGDVARKAVILARMSGLQTRDDPVTLTGLVEPGLLGTPIEALLVRLKALDAPLAAKIADARKQSCVLRFVARVEKGNIEVGPQAVAADSPLGALRGTDNMICFHTARYSKRPLVIAGPGAGAEVTAMAVLTDILRIKPVTSGGGA